MTRTPWTKHLIPLKTGYNIQVQLMAYVQNEDVSSGILSKVQKYTANPNLNLNVRTRSQSWLDNSTGNKSNVRTPALDAVTSQANPLCGCMSVRQIGYHFGFFTISHRAPFGNTHDMLHATTPVSRCVFTQRRRIFLIFC